MMWSALKKKLKELITPELKNRVDIYQTNYHEAHDNHGETWITIDGEKVFGGGYFYWYNAQIPKEVKNDYPIRYGYHQDFFQPIVVNEHVQNILNQGIHETSHITWSIEKYIQTPFEDILESNHPIYRAFSLIDRRLGKRRFDKIILEEKEHPLVLMFYHLRKDCFTK